MTRFDGRLELPGGLSLAVEARGAGATVRALEGEQHAVLALEGTPPGGDDDTLELVARYDLEPRVVWTPHLAPEEGNVVGDAVFRAPALILASDRLALALIPDLDDVAGARGFRTFMDHDAPEQTFTLAAGAYRAEGHVFYRREPARFAGQPVRLRLHVLASERSEDVADPFGMVARFHWARWGRPRHLAAAPPPIARHAERILRWAFEPGGWGDSVWQELEVSGARIAAPVFIVDVTRHPSVPPAERRWREPRSLWNQAWFSTQRVANGLLAWARQTRDPSLAARARSMTELALAAPQVDGLFPSVLRADEPTGTGRWTNSDRRPPSASERACHLVDAAFTCRMLLDWGEDDPRIEPRIRAFADRAVALQRPSGAFPGWVEPDGAVPPELAEGPESAVTATLLFELAARTGEGRYRDAAARALPFLREVAEDGRWEDFETYYSCAPWGAPEHLGRRIPRSGVHKQNTLSIAWTAEAFLAAWRATGERAWLERARRAASELVLYQAVWDPPWLPAPSLGGFGVMNADCEWNDARQSLFAPLLFELARETRDRDLEERAVAAVRASFAMLYCPENAALARAYEARHPTFGPETYGFMMENQGHDPGNPIGTFTIFTWGNGSALATAALVRERFPEHAAACGLP